MPNVIRKTTARRSLGVALALAIGAFATLLLPVDASATSPVVHRVSAGTPDGCRAVGAHPGCDRNYTLTATEYADGSVVGELIDSSPFGNVHGVIDCLVVEGNQAWLSGEVTNIPDLYFVTSVVDNGTSANDPVDQISFTDVEHDPQDCSTQPDVTLLDVPEGQVKVS